MPASKTCFKCGKTKPIDEFYRHPMMADGRVNKCKECNKRDSRENRARKVDYYRAYDLRRAKAPERAMAAAEISSRWRSSDPRIIAAHSAVARAVRSGRLVRPDGCSKCGRSPVYGHHESYDRKLDVTWLCQPCHKERHKEMAAAGIEP